MAEYRIPLGGNNPDTDTIDQSDITKGDWLRVEHTGSPPETVNFNINNSNAIGDKLSFGNSTPTGCTTNVNLGADANIVMNNVWLTSTAGFNNYKLGEGSTLEFNLYESTKVLSNVSFDLGDTGNSTLVFNSGTSTVDYSNPPKITGLSAGDQVQITGATQGGIEGNNLVFRNDDGKVMGNFDASGQDLSKVTFEGGTMNYACYLKGTHIATPTGEVKVETLRIGDKVMTASGNVSTVKWLGHRALYKSRIPAKDVIRAFPILFKKDSIAQNIPHRDLTLSPGHHICFNDMLVPAMMLVNGHTIVQQFDAKVFVYFHVELEQFDIMLAEGVPTESYVDTGNRNMFQNAAEVAFNPDFGPPAGRPEVDGIKVVQRGPEVEAIRKKLLVRAEKMTGMSLSEDAALYIEVNGERIESTPAFSKEGVYHFALPAETGDVHVLSRSATVREVTVHARRDLRKIGVGLSGIAVIDANGRRELDLLDQQIQGLNAAQNVHGREMRWTDGHATIPAPIIAPMGPATLELTVLRTYTYWVQDSVNAIWKVA